MTLNVKERDSNEFPMTQFDFLARVCAWLPATDRLWIYAYGAPGYSVRTTQERLHGTASGFVVDFGAGATLTIIGGVYLSLEAGYSLGFQKLGESAWGTQFLNVAAGAGMRL